jgi:hypothetical protein
VADYLLPEGMTPAAVTTAIASRLSIRDGRRIEADRTYYDTFDGLLHAASLAAVWEDGQLAVIERGSGASRATAACLRQTSRPGACPTHCER